MTTLRAILFLALVSPAAGCFDVHTVNSSTLVVDTFDDPNGNPINPSFERWECRPHSEDRPIADEDCNITPLSAPASTVLHLGATLHPPVSTNNSFARSEVATVAIPPGVDLSSYSKFLFSAMLASRDAMWPIKPSLTVQLVCKGACPPEILNPSNNPCSIISTVVYTEDTWQDHVLDLYQFQPAGDQATGMAIVNCLAQVNGLKITLDASPAVLEGVAKFDLYVDDIYLTPRN